MHFKKCISGTRNTFHRQARNGKATLGDAQRPPVQRVEPCIYDGQRRCKAGPSAQETDRGRLYCEDLADADTPVQAQTQAMGAARRDPRRGESPVKHPSQMLFLILAAPGEVVSSTGKHGNFKCRCHPVYAGWHQEKGRKNGQRRH